jgi:hypothetical protein
MNIRLLWGALWMAAFAFPCAAVMPVDADPLLRNASSFALGGIGVAGTMSAGERALREVLQKPDLPSRLEKLATEASPAGQLYALLGLRTRDRAAYARVLEKLQKTDATVETARGCILQRESFRDLLKEIERGNYDTFLAREWHEPGR